MPIPLFDKKQQIKTENENLLSLSFKSQTIINEKKDDQATRERVLRKKRSDKYLNMLSKLDCGEHVDNSQAVNDIIEEIRDEFPEITIPGDFIGIVQLCLLGKPYEVHIIDFAEKIIEHYTKGKPLPNGMEIARNIAQNKAYKFIEVYSHCLRAIDHNGGVSVIEI